MIYWNELQQLDLDAFADELERQGFGDKSITLYDVRNELNDRYKDLRVPYQQPSQEEIFNMVTKETPETLYIGKLFTASVTGFAYRKPQREQLDPIRNELTGLWQCPFCFKLSYKSNFACCVPSNYPWISVHFRRQDPQSGRRRQESSTRSRPASSSRKTEDGNGCHLSTTNEAK